MKYSILKISVCVTILASVLFLAGCNEQSSAFQVNDVVSDPGAYSGTLTIEGVVYAYSQNDESIVGIMDKKELQCTTPNCNKALLAVKVSGLRLAIGDEVIVSGAMVKAGRSYMLQASDVEVVGNHQLGGRS